MKRGVKTLSNVSRGLGLKAAIMAGPSLTALVALAGVTLPPALRVSESERQLELAHARAAEFERERARSTEFSGADVPARLERALTLVRSRTPVAVDEIVAQGAVRLAAERAGLHVDGLTIGMERDPGLAQTSDRIVMTLVELVGSGPLFASVRLQQALESMGHPCCVLEAHASLSGGDRARNELRLLLGLFHLAPPLALEGPQSAAPVEESL